MENFVQAFLTYLFKFAIMAFVAGSGAYVGYWSNHKRAVYFKKQRKAIKKYGRLVAYLNRNYRAVFKKRIFGKKKNIGKDELYRKCYYYASKFDICEINSAKAYLKRDLKISELTGVLVAIIVGFGSSLIYSYAYSLSLLFYGIDSSTILTEEQQFILNNF